MGEGRGAEVVEVSLPAHEICAARPITSSRLPEASSNLARYDGVRYGARRLAKGGRVAGHVRGDARGGFGAEVKRRIMIGTYVLSAGVLRCLFHASIEGPHTDRAGLRPRVESCDLLLTPATPSAAFSPGAQSDNPLAMYLNDVFTVPSSLAGLPAMAVPGGVDGQGLPLGLQVIGKALDEQAFSTLCRAIEERAGFTARARLGGDALRNWKLDCLGWSGSAAYCRCLAAWSWVRIEQAK